LAAEHLYNLQHHNLLIYRMISYWVLLNSEEKIEEKMFLLIVLVHLIKMRIRTFQYFYLFDSIKLIFIIFESILSLKYFLYYWNNLS